MIQVDETAIRFAESLNAAQDKIDARERRKQTGNSVDFKLREPMNIFKSSVAPSFDFEEVPAYIANLAYHFSAATGFDRSGIMVAALAAAASVIHDGYRIAVKPRSNWFESARLWVLLVLQSGGGKSPTIRAATDRIKTMHEAAVIRWIEENQDLGDGEKPSPRPSLYTSDTTIAALEEVLKDNDRGILMLTEEFGSWIGAIEGTSKGEGASNRANWLHLYDGGSKQSDRIRRGNVLIPNWSASVLSACPPDALRRHLKQMPEDGLIHRFIPVIMAAPNLDADDGDSREAQEMWNNRLRDLYHSISPATIHLSPDARKHFEEEHRYVRQLTMSTLEFAPSLGSALNKHGGHLARIALIFHALTNPQMQELPADTMLRAINFMKKVRKHQAALFNHVLGGSDALTLAQSLGRSIVAEDPARMTVGRAWMSDHCSEFRSADEKLRMEAIQVLTDADWLEASPGSRTYRGLPAHYLVHERLATQFAAEGEAHRAHRSAVRAALGEGT